MTKLDIYTWSYSVLAQLLTFMHILKENKIIFITTLKQKYTENNTKFSAPHFTSSQVLILYQWVKLFGHQVNLGKLDPSTPNHVDKHA